MLLYFVVVHVARMYACAVCCVVRYAGEEEAKEVVGIQRRKRRG